MAERQIQADPKRESAWRRTDPALPKSGKFHRVSLARRTELGAEEEQQTRQQVEE